MHIYYSKNIHNHYPTATSTQAHMHGHPFFDLRRVSLLYLSRPLDDSGRSVVS